MDEFSARVNCLSRKPSLKCLTTGLSELADRTLSSRQRGEHVGWHNVIQVSVSNTRALEVTLAVTTLFRVETIAAFGTSVLCFERYNCPCKCLKNYIVFLLSF